MYIGCVYTGVSIRLLTAALGLTKLAAILGLGISESLSSGDDAHLEAP